MTKKKKKKSKVGLSLKRLNISISKWISKELQLLCINDALQTLLYSFIFWLWMRKLSFHEISSVQGQLLPRALAWRRTLYMDPEHGFALYSAKVANTVNPLLARQVLGSRKQETWRSWNTPHAAGNSQAEVLTTGPIPIWAISLSGGLLILMAPNSESYDPLQLHGPRSL